MKYIDTHCHLDFPEFDRDRAEIIQRAFEEGLIAVINVGTSLKSTKKCLSLTSLYQNCWATAGIHPHHVREVKTGELEELAVLAREEKVVAIGETGLDYHYGREDAAAQKELFRWHLRLARQLHLPVVVHQRESRDDLLTVLKEEGLPERLVFHCFGGDSVLLKYACQHGCYCSFTGTITFEKADAVREAAASLPDELILVETDAPYLAPHPWRGHRNEPGRVRLVAEAVASVRGQRREEVFRLLVENALKFFHLEISESISDERKGGK